MQHSFMSGYGFDLSVFLQIYYLVSENNISYASAQRFLEHDLKMLETKPNCNNYMRSEFIMKTRIAAAILGHRRQLISRSMPLPIIANQRESLKD